MSEHPPHLTVPPPLSRPPQFHLRTLMRTVAWLCVLFALLGALGVQPGAAAAGFAFVILASLAATQVVEFIRKIRRSRTMQDGGLE